MNSKEIEQIVKDYLISKKVNFEAVNEKDECSLRIKELGSIFYIECHANYYQGIRYPGDKDYPSQAEGCPCPCYRSSPSYMFVCDKIGNIIVDLTEIVHGRSDAHIVEWLDDKNIILPIKSDTPFSNNYQHYKIENGKATLVKTFNSFPNISDVLVKNKLVAFGGELYNFENGIVLGNEFSGILTSSKPDVKCLAGHWKIPDNQCEEFADVISEKMKSGNLVGGYKKVIVKKAGYWFKYDTCIFVDKNGNFASDLYYVDGYNFTSIDNVTPDNYKLAIQQLENQLVSKIDAILLEKEKQNGILHQVIKKLSI